ncbi:MAG: branched-chain amino acid ABC transporter permease [Nocardioides sp.]|nr:branched-chain amino acid ABC transporter permease [Nocardioides sp.]
MSTRLRGRPELYTSYGQEMSLLNTRAKALGVLAILAVAVYLPMGMEDDLLRVLNTGLVFAIGAIGLNLLTGYAGQVSLGHAFFIGVGAYTAAALSGDPDGRYIGFGITNPLIWVPAAGLVAAACGLLIAPLATRLRGLYLAIVTLGLVFIGQYFFIEWRSLSGGAQVGREAATPILFGADLTRAGAFSEEQKLFWFFLVLLVIFAVLARNIARSKIGRAFAAIRDRDIAAGVMGVELSRYKLIAFGLSSFYAGVAGSLMFVASGTLGPEQFGLLLSVQFIAMVLIGGVATISGAIMGAMLIAMLPRIASELPHYLPFLSRSPIDSPNIFEFELIAYGALIVAFLLFEPRGLFGIWLRIRTYWKSFPFSY